MNSSSTNNQKLRAALVRLCTSCGVSWENPKDGLSITQLTGHYLLVLRGRKIVLRDKSIDRLIAQMDGARLLIDLHDEAYHGAENTFRL